MPEPAPGPWLRLTALGASAAVLVAVISGAAGVGTAHRVLAALALPPLVALAAAAVLEYRRLVVPAFTSLVLFGVGALLSAPGLLRYRHGCAAATTVTAALTAAATSLRAAWRLHHADAADMTLLR